MPILDTEHATAPGSKVVPADDTDDIAQSAPGAIHVASAHRGSQLNFVPSRYRVKPKMALTPSQTSQPRNTAAAANTAITTN